MWGGIVGEDGPEGLQLGNSGLGNAFSEFQHALLQLSQRGFLLAVASKNNPADALEVLEKHPDMVLRPDNFACLKINWQDKPSNLREIARELNIGIDSLVFLDDNPVERSIMRQALPEVLTVELPSDPALYRRTLLELPEMDVLQVTEEDLARARMYHEQQARDQFQKQLDSSGAGIEKFLWDLQQRVIVARADNLSLPRIAQLINKTNQFNLTTIRYTEAQVREMAASTQTHRVYGIKVIDRFGDNGLTGVAIIETGVESWRIDTLLLSCRVMGRTVETALLNYLMEQARASGATLLEGEYRPTAKNSVVARLYPEHGFSLLEEKDNNTRWGLELTATEPQIPGWIKFEVID
jgi:FkbH-like protein